MKVSYDILQKFVTPPKKFSARALSELLTMSVVEVDGCEDQAEKLANVVVGLVTKVDPHPNADKLKLAQVEVGRTKYDVVCGGANLRQGMKVAFAKVGARVRWHGQGDWITLETAKIRGQESHGMICAAEELELPDSAAVEHGIMDLSHIPAKPGTLLAEALGLSDIILDIDNKSITHRPDLWGHLGLARELAALWGAKLHQPELPELKADIDVPLMVSTKAGSGLQRYLAVALTGVKVAPSPVWLTHALLSLGMRPINNVVDVTNYVMAELGQPLHAFDLEKLASPEIVVRYAKKGETLLMLDGVTRELDGETLVIADKKKPLAVAGVMGGEGSGVTDTTTGIVLESATFEPVGVRLTASRLGLRTEASARFEKALDPALAEVALKRTVALLHEVCPSARVASPVVDVFPKAPELRVIELSLPWLYKRLGVEISAKEVLDILGRLGFKVEEKQGELAVTVPSWRATRDITIPEDLVEEVARIYGYGKIPLTMPKFDITPPARDEAQELRWKIRDLLVGTGWAETLSYSFVSADGSAVDLVELTNPVNEAERFMRPALLPNVLSQCIANTLHLPHQPVRQFELGRVFTAASSDWPANGASKARLPHQTWHLALVLRLPDASLEQTFRALKGAVEDVARSLRVTVSFEAVENQSGRVLFDGKDVGTINVEQVMRSSLKPIVAQAELDLTSLVPGERVVVSSAVSQSVEVRDISVVTPPGVTWAAIEKHVRAASPLVGAVEVFDVYQEKGSIAFHLTFRSAEGALTSEAVDAVIRGLTQSLQQTFGVMVRS